VTVTQTHIRQLEASCFVMQWIIVGYALWIGLGILGLREHPSLPDLGRESAGVPAPGPSASRRPLDELAGIWKRDLRQTLIDPPPKETPKPKPPPAPPPIELPRLLATFNEEGRSWGLFVDKHGAHRVHTTSQQIDGFDIVAVLPGAAELKRDDKQYQVSVPVRTPQGRSPSRGQRSRTGT